MVRVVLIHSGPVILPELEENLGVYAQKILAGRKIEIHLKTKIESFVSSSRARWLWRKRVPTDPSPNLGS
jgi:NADH dehydrogenase FAD-containing subunit